VNHKLLLVVVFGLLLAAGFGATLWLDDSHRATADQQGDLRDDEHELTLRLAAMEKQLASQGEQLRSLRERLDLRDAPLPARSTETVAEEPTSAKVQRAVVQAAQQPLVAANGEPTPVLEQSVRAVMERVKDEEKLAEIEREKLARERRVKERVERLAPELGLDAYQTSQLTNIFIDTEEKLSGLRNTWRQGAAGFDPAQGNPFAEIMTARDEKLKLVLSGSQMEKLSDSEPGRRWMQGDRRPPADPGAAPRNRNRNRGDQSGNNNNGGQG
jgi:hypothetical protein